MSNQKGPLEHRRPGQQLLLKRCLVALKPNLQLGPRLETSSSSASVGPLEELLLQAVAPLCPQRRALPSPWVKGHWEDTLATGRMIKARPQIALKTEKDTAGV